MDVQPGAPVYPYLAGNGSTLGVVKRRLVNEKRPHPRQLTSRDFSFEPDKFAPVHSPPAVVYRPGRRSSNRARIVYIRFRTEFRFDGTPLTKHAKHFCLLDVPTHHHHHHDSLTPTVYFSLSLQGYSDCRRATRNWCTRTWRQRWSTRPAPPVRNNRPPCCSGSASWAGSSRRPDNSRSYCPCPTRRRPIRRPPISAANRPGPSPKSKIPKRPLSVRARATNVLLLSSLSSRSCSRAFYFSVRRLWDRPTKQHGANRSSIPTTIFVQSFRSARMNRPNFDRAYNRFRNLTPV